MKTISFNTGRKYTAEGQFVVATLHDDGVVTFFDHSRGIDGLFKLGQHCAFNQTEVMRWYDSGNAGGTKRSWGDGMLRDGCNARPQVQAPAEEASASGRGKQMKSPCKFTVVTRHAKLAALSGEHVFTCHQDASNGTWYAIASKFGCSKNYATPESAIREMARDHAACVESIVENIETPVQEKPAREYKASIGSISEGTLKTDDLIEAFASELSYILGEQAGDSKLLTEAGDWLEQDEDVRDEDEGSELVTELEDALSENAPAYCFFGTLEGDGACFGFWPSMDEISELPRVEGSDEAKALGEDCAFVNDHGNVTVYGGDGSIILELV